jgi:cytochrome b561
VSHVLGLVHAYGSWILIALLGIHIGAAVRHHVVKRDPILARMVPVIIRK